MKKLTGETKLLLIMGLIVLGGGSFLAFGPGSSTNSSATAQGGSPEPEATPKPMDTATFKKLWDSSPHRKGMANGSPPELSIIEFADVECSSCRMAYGKITKNFGKSIPAELAFRHFPLNIHTFGKPCANALEAAGRQDKFWELYEALFEDSQPALSQEYIEQKATRVGLDMTRFRKDTTDAAIAQNVDKDTAVALEIGVTHTPTFYILDRKKNTVQAIVGPRGVVEKMGGTFGIPTADEMKKTMR
jgi:protein-disulfide isomerase